MKTLLAVAALGLLSACGEGDPGTPAGGPGAEPATTVPLPDDFYAALREKGGAEPYDNIYYVSADSVSYEAFYFNLHHTLTYQPQPGEIETLYQELLQHDLESVEATLDQIERVFERGGDIAELHANGQTIARSNADNGTITPATWPRFNAYCISVRDFVLRRLEPRMRRIDLDIAYAKPTTQYDEVTVAVNNFQLVAWTPLDASPEAPATGYNAVLPGDYHLIATIRSGDGYLSVQDTLQVRGAARRLKMEVFSDRIEFNKLN